MENDIYTVFYCDNHSQGIIVRGKHDDCGNEFAHFGCSLEDQDDCLYDNYGLISQGNFDDCCADRVDYDRKSGGWKLKMFLHGVFTEVGKPLEAPPWMKDYFNSTYSSD